MGIGLLSTVKDRDMHHSLILFSSLGCLYCRWTVDAISNRVAWRCGMTQTAVGLFENCTMAQETVEALKAEGFAANDLRILIEPRYMPVTGVLSTPDTDFCAALRRDLRAMGATDEEAQAYVQGVRHGGALVFANGTADELQGCVDVMNRNHASNVEELATSDSIHHGAERPMPSRSGYTQSGRTRFSGGGARIFVW